MGDRCAVLSATVGQCAGTEILSKGALVLGLMYECIVVCMYRCVI
jgi:hypothetical protein